MHANYLKKYMLLKKCPGDADARDLCATFSIANKKKVTHARPFMALCSESLSVLTHGISSKFSLPMLFRTILKQKIFKQF